MLLSFHHTKVQPSLLAGYVLVDNVIVAPLNLYIGLVVVVVHPFCVALKVNEFTATVPVSQLHQFHNESFALTLHV